MGIDKQQAVITKLQPDSAIKPLVILLVSEYPQLSQTYKENEARAMLYRTVS
jgi:hypothetical protein